MMDRIVVYNDAGVAAPLPIYPSTVLPHPMLDGSRVLFWQDESGWHAGTVIGSEAFRDTTTWRVRAVWAPTPYDLMLVKA